MKNTVKNPREHWPFFCLIGFHSFRQRKNGMATEKVCMRDGCTCVRTFYTVKREKDDKGELWNEKKIPVRHHSFKKQVKE